MVGKKFEVWGHQKEDLGRTAQLVISIQLGYCPLHMNRYLTKVVGVFTY